MFILSFGGIPLSLCPSPSPCASFQPLKDALCKKVQVPCSGFIDVPCFSPPGSPPNQVSRANGLGSPPTPDLRLLGREQERERAFGAGCSDCNHRLFRAGCPSPSEPCIPSPKQQALCLHSATFGMHEHGCRERGGGFLKKVQWLRQKPLDESPKFEEASALMESAGVEVTMGCQDRGASFIL